MSSAMPGPPAVPPLPGPPIRWQTARVLAIHDETARAKTFRLQLPHRTRHMPATATSDWPTPTVSTSTTS